MGILKKTFQTLEKNALLPAFLNVFIEKYSFAALINDIFAGIKTFCLLFPVLISLAICCGESPIAGLKSGIAALIVSCIIGGTKYQISAISFPICILTTEIITKYQYKGLLITSFLVCIALIIFGILKIGELFKYTAHAFLSAIYVYVAIAIIMLQLQFLFGTNLSLLTSNIFRAMSSLQDIFQDITLVKLRLGIIFIGSLVILKIIFKGYTSFFIYLLLSSILTIFSEMNIISIVSNSELKTIGIETFNCLNSNNIFLISYTLPSKLVLSNLVIFAFAISIVICAQVSFCISLGEGLTANKQTPTNIELVSTGISNFVSVSCGGLFVSPDNELSMKNIQYKSKSMISALSVIVLLFTVYKLKDYIFCHIPIHAIIAILMLLSINTIKNANITQYKVNTRDTYVFWSTIIVAFCFGFVSAVFIGFIFSLLVFSQRIINIKEPLVHTNKNHDRYVKEFLSNKYGYLKTQKNIPKVLFEQVELIRIQNILSLNLLEKIRQLLLSRGTFPKFIIIYFQNIPFLDGESFRILREFVRITQKKECVVILCGTNGLLLEIIQRKEKELNERNAFGYIIPNFQDALSKIIKTLKV